MKWILTGTAAALLSTLACGEPMTELWREDLVNVLNGAFYHATAVTLDEEDDLFVGGGVLLSVTATRFPFVAKFSPSGVKLWEYWPDVDEMVADSFISSLASDMNGGVFIACRDGAYAFQLKRLNAQGVSEFSIVATNYGAESGYYDTTSCMVSDHADGFYLVGIWRDPPTIPDFHLNVARYGSDGQKLWSTNLLSGLLPGYDMNRCAFAAPDSMVVCGNLWPSTKSQLAKLSKDGEIQWILDSAQTTFWREVTVMRDGAIGVSGERSCQVFSSAGERLAVHGLQDTTFLSYPDSQAEHIMAFDAGSRNLLQLSSQGAIDATGQLMDSYGTRAEIVSLSSNEWLIAQDASTGNYPQDTDGFAFHCMDVTGALKWRQPFPGYEYAEADTPNHWLLKASDGTVRLVVNLSDSLHNPHMGIGAASFRLGGSVEGPVLKSALPEVVFNGPDGVDLEVEAEGTGQLQYQWYFNSYPYWPPSTNASIHVPAGLNSIWTVKIQDELGEILSSGIRVRGGTTTLGLAEHASYGWMLSVTSDYAAEFKLQSSSNCIDWTESPVIYSWLSSMPLDALIESTNRIGAVFFRSVDLPEQ